MAFPREAVRTPTAIGEIEIKLTDPDPVVAGETQQAHYNVEVKYSDGTVKRLRGNLVPHLTQQQINGLLSFLAAMRVQAVSQILPE